MKLLSHSSSRLTFPNTPRICLKSVRRILTANHLAMFAMQEKSKIVLKEVFENPLDSHHARVVQKLADEMVKCVLTRDEVLLDMPDMQTD